MTGAYSFQEIHAYAESALSFFSAVDPNERRRITNDLIGVISRYPPWMQTILIEARAQYYAGTQADISALYRRIWTESRPNEPPNFNIVNGFYLDRRYKLFPDRLDTKNVVDVSFFSHDTDNPDHTIRHEDGHHLDALLASSAEVTQRYFSDHDQGWKDKVTTGDVKNKNVLRMLAEKVFPDTKEPLYDGYRHLADHLKLYKDPKNHPRESFAEMSAHYFSLYEKTGGNEHSIDSILKRRYPDLWREYRDRYIPLAKEYAAILSNRRDVAIKNYVERRLDIHALDDRKYDTRPLDRDALIQEAKILSATGALAKKSQRLADMLDISDEPTVAYIGEVRAFWRLIGYEASAQDWIDLSRRAARTEENLGKMGLCRQTLDLRAECDVLESYLDARKYLTVDFETDPVQDYRRLREGGLDHVITETRMLIRDDVRDYLAARGREAELIDQMNRSLEKSPNYHADTMAAAMKDVRHHFSCDQEIPLKEKAEILKARFNVLARFLRDIDTIDSCCQQYGRSFYVVPDINVSVKAFNEKYETNPDFMEREQGEGLSQTTHRYIYAEIDKIDLMKQIASEGANITYAFSKGMFVPLKKGAELPDNFRKDVFCLAVSAYLAGGEEGIENATADLKREMHDMILTIKPELTYKLAMKFAGTESVTVAPSAGPIHLAVSQPKSLSL